MLSRRLTVNQFWAEGVKHFPHAVFAPYEKIDLVDRSVQAVIPLVYGQVLNAYMTPQELAVTNDVASIATLPIMRGYEHKLILESVIGGGGSTALDVAQVVSVVAGSQPITFPVTISGDYIIFARLINGGGTITGATSTGFTFIATDAGTLQYYVHVLGQGTPSGRGSVIAGEQVISFGQTISMPYVLLANLRDAGGNGVAADITDMNTTGFTVNPIEPATLEYYAVEVNQSLPAGLLKNVGAVAVPPAGSTGVTFPTPMASSSYVLLPPALIGASGAGLGFSLSAESGAGFTVNNGEAEAGTFYYVAADIGQVVTTSGTPEVRRLFDPLSVEGLRTWRPTAFQNRNRMVFAYNGEELFLSKWAGLSTYGTVIARFPRIPTKATTGDQLVDLPDGAPLELGLISLKMKLAARAGAQPNGELDQAALILKSFMQQQGIAPQYEELKKKVEALQ